MADPKTGQDQPRNPSVKSHPNDSEPQVRGSMEGLPPNTAPPVKSPHYTVNNGQVVNDLDGSVAAEGGDDDELQKTADQMNAAVKQSQDQAKKADEEARQKNAKR